MATAVAVVVVVLPSEVLIVFEQIPVCVSV